MDLHTGPSYWLLANGLLATYPPLAADERCEVAVVGGGVSGALVAHRLAVEGVDVVVLDRRDAATGSTVASTGLLLYETDTELRDLASRVGESDAVRCWRLGEEAIREIERTVADLGDGCGFARRDTLYLASSPRHARRLAREVEARRRHGFDVELWDAAELARRGVAAPARAAIHATGGAQVDAYRLTHRLLAAATRRGARVYDRTTVTHVEPAPAGTPGGGVVLATDRGTRVRARRVVHASGYEAARFLPERAGRLRSTFAVASEPVRTFDGWPEGMLVWESARPYLYLRTTADGRAVVGGLDGRAAREHRLPGLVRRRAATLTARFRELFPSIPFEPAFAWGGTFGETSDGMPYIGAHPAVPDAYFVLGYGGNGITFSAIAAGIVADLVRGRPAPDARLFRFGR